MKSLLLSLGLCLGILSAFGQELLVTGTIQDAETGEAMIGVQVVEKGTANGTLSQQDGTFSLRVKRESGNLVLSFVGYLRQEVPFQVGNPLDLKMQVQVLDDYREVVITALGINRARRELGYAVQKLDNEDLSRVRETNLVNALAGKIAGVQTTNGSSGVGSSARIVIRGENSLSGTNQPLFVVDGVPIYNELYANNTENLEAEFQEVDYGNGAAEISPDDIASISVLKGAGAAALYGSRAANGVVVIQTKEGRPGPGVGISLHSSLTVESLLTFPEFQNGYGQGAGGVFSYEDGFGAGENDGGITSFGPALNGQLIKQFDSPSTDAEGNPVRAGDIFARNGNEITPTPWVANPDNVRNFFQTGLTFNNHIALTAGSEKSRVRMAYTRLDNKGVIPNTDLTRNSLSLNLSQSLNSRLSTRAFVNYIQSSSTHRPALGYGSENPMYLFTWMGRQANTASLEDYWQAGQQGFEQFNYNYRWMDNPYFSVFENTNGFVKDRVLGNISVNYALAEGLNLRLRSGMDYYHDLRASKRAFSSQRFQQGGYREDEITAREINTDVLLSYQRALGNDWNLNLGLGGNAMEQRLDYKSTEAGELSLPGIYNFENSRIPLVITQEKLAKRINSAYALAGLAYDKAIYLDLTFRNDWSSTLPAGQNSFGYYSAATSLVLSELLEMPEVINYAKLRLSGASVGNDTEPFQLTNTFAFNQNYGAFPLVTKTAGLLNANLRPERMQAVELGGEIWLWQDKLGLDVSVYQNVSTDQIIQLPTSAASGYVERVINGGRIRSRGLEASLSVGLYQGADFYWRATANFAANRSFVMELPEGVENYVTGFSSVYNSTQNAVFFVANPNLGRVGDMYGTGILQHEGQDVYDANGIPVRDPNLRLLGNYNPDFIMGLNNEFGYKNFKFSFLFDWRQGGIILSRLFSIGSTSGVLASTLPGREEGVIGEGVTNIGTTAEPQYVENTSRIAASDFYGQYYNRANEATATFDASYVKLRNISLSYDLPTGLTQKWGLGQASLALIANNVLLFTENPNVDPELSTMQGRRFAYGVEDMAYPSSRSLGVSLRIKL